MAVFRSAAVLPLLVGAAVAMSPDPAAETGGRVSADVAQPSRHVATAVASDGLAPVVRGAAVPLIGLAGGMVVVGAGVVLSVQRRRRPARATPRPPGPPGESSGERRVHRQAVHPPLAEKR